MNQKLADLRARHAPSNIPVPGPNASWHEEQAYGARIQAEWDKARATAPEDIAYLLAELDTAHRLLQTMWMRADEWHGERASSHFRSEINYQLSKCLHGEAGGQ